MLGDLSSLSYRLFVACSHNIDAPAIAALSVDCVSDKTADDQFVVDVVKESWSAVAEFEILDRKALVSALLSHYRLYKVCIVSILRFKPSPTK